MFYILFVSILMLLNGCATILSKSSDEILINSDPSGVEIFRNAKKIGETPLTVNVKRETFEQPYLILKKPGFKPYRLNLEKVIDKTSLFNFTFFLTTSGATCFGVDALSGSLLQYSPTGYLVELKKDDEDLVFQNFSTLSNFVISNFDNLKADIAKGEGDFLKAIYYTMHTKLDYNDFLTKITKVKNQLLNTANGLELSTKIKSSCSSESLTIP